MPLAALTKTPIFQTAPEAVKAAKVAKTPEYTHDGLLKVTVYRDTWLRGPQGVIESVLLYKPDDYCDEDEIEVPELVGHMCCLGFAAEAAGWTCDRLAGVSVPSSLNECGYRLPLLSKTSHPGGPDKDPHRAVTIEGVLTAINDMEMPDRTRESLLMIAGKIAGIYFTFLDAPTTPEEAPC